MVDALDSLPKSAQFTSRSALRARTPSSCSIGSAGKAAEDALDQPYQRKPLVPRNGRSGGKSSSKKRPVGDRSLRATKSSTPCALASSTAKALLSLSHSGDQLSTYTEGPVRRGRVKLHKKKSQAPTPSPSMTPLCSPPVTEQNNSESSAKKEIKEVRICM
eukprot:g61904.t1